MSFRRSQNFCGVIREHEPQQVCEPYAILCKMAKQRCGVFAEHNLLGRWFNQEPLVFTKQRKNVVRVEWIFTRRMRLDVLRRGHEEIPASIPANDDVFVTCAATT